MYEIGPHATDPSLSPASLNGRIVYRSLPGEPLREYFLYIPRNYCAQRLVVLMHGISEGACEQISRFARYAELRGVVLVAPLMQRVLYGQYQQLVDSRRGIRADIALLDIVQAVRAEAGLPGTPFDLFGFSGGGQFAHRFALANPRSVRACVLAAAGWYSFPNCGKPFPRGLAGLPTVESAFDPDAARSIPFHVVIGEQDIIRDTSLRRSRAIDREQGRTRLERAHRWHQAMLNWGADSRSSLTILPQVGHSFAEAVRRHDLPSIVFELLKI